MPRMISTPLKSKCTEMLPLPTDAISVTSRAQVKAGPGLPCGTRRFTQSVTVAGCTSRIAQCTARLTGWIGNPSAISSPQPLFFLSLGGVRLRTMRLLAIMLLVFGAGGAGSSAPQQTAPAVRPPLLFKEEWRLPKHEGAATDENTRFTPEVVTNARHEAKLYGMGSAPVRAA